MMKDESTIMEEIINEIFKERVEKMKKKVEFEEQSIKPTEEEISKREMQFRIAVDNIPTALKETRRNIVNSFIDYIEILNMKNQSYYEKYYKQGIIDGIKLMKDVLK